MKLKFIQYFNQSINQSIRGIEPPESEPAQGLMYETRDKNNEKKLLYWLTDLLIDWVENSMILVFEGFRHTLQSADRVVESLL